MDHFKKLLFPVLFFNLLMLSERVTFAQKFEEHRIGNQKTELQVISSNSQRILLRNVVGNIKTAELTTQDGNFSVLMLDGYYYAGDEGKPGLPVQNRLLIVPPGMKPEVRVLKSNQKEIELSEKGIKNPIFPQQPSAPKRQDAGRTKFQIDRKTYRKDAFIGEEFVRIEVLGQMRGHLIARLSISPVQYNPVQNRIRIITESELEISFTPGESVLKSVTTAQTTPYDDFVFRNFLNPPENLLKAGGYSSGPMKYMILSDPIFKDALVPFVEWKTQKGFEVLEIYKGEDGVGTTNTAMREHIRGIYLNSPPESRPVFLLIVGDHEQIPAFSASGHVTDLYYAEFDGDGDYFPEIYYGRFSAQNVEQLLPQIEKTLMYEKYEFPDPAFLDEVVMIAGVDGRYAPTHGNGHINYAVNYYLNAGNSIQSHTYLYPESGQNALSIVQNISDGAGFVNYTGHGLTDRWEAPLFHMNSIDTLLNFGKYPLVIGNGCRTARFNVPLSLGEAFLRAAGKGAVGYIGGTNDTYWNEDYYWAVGLGPIVSNPAYEETSLGMFDKTFHLNGEPDQVWTVTQGQMIHAGNMAVTEGGSRVKFYWEVYHLMGDPSVMTYFSQPSVQTPVFSQQIPVGANRIIVQADPYSYVALSQGAELLDARHTSPFGIAELYFNQVQDEGEIKLVITKNQRQPFISNIHVVDYSQPYVAYLSHVIKDFAGNNNGIAENGENFAIDLSLKNYGAMEANDLTVKIYTDDPFVTILDSETGISTIPAGETWLLENAFSLLVSPQVPDGHQVVLHVFLEDDESRAWNSYFPVSISAPSLAVGAYWFEDETGKRVNMMAGETATLMIELLNSGSTGLNDFITTVTCNPSIQLENPSVFSGSLPYGGSIILPFNLELPPIFAYGAEEEFLLGITSPLFTAQLNLPVILNGLWEDFESGDFSFIPWTNQSPVQWTILENSGPDASFSARSGSISHNQSTSIFVQMDVPEDDEVSFWLKVSSEKNYDYLRFYINDIEIAKWSGTERWTKVKFPVQQGINELRWTYTKDGSISSGTDAAWLDKILFPGGTFISEADVVDLGVTALLKPVSGDNMVDLQVVEAEVRNFGNISVGSIPLVFEINGNIAVQELMTITIPPGETRTYEFLTKADLSAKGDYNIKVFSNHIADANRDNDTLIVTVTHSSPSGIDVPDEEQWLLIYPNPAKNIVYLKLHPDLLSENLVMNLTDLSGRVVREFQMQAGRQIHEISLHGIQSGFYIISVINKSSVINGRIYIY